MGEDIGEALGAGLALARRAWREAPAPLAVSALGWTAVSAAGRAELPPEAASALGWTGLALVLLMAAPKLGALHRLAAGEAARGPVGAWGLQWTGLENRLAATATALAATAALLLAALGGAAAALHATDRALGAGPAGDMEMLLALAAAGAAAVSAVGRLSVTLAADAAEPAPRFARGWELTRGAGWAPGAAWLLTAGLPGAALLGAPALLDALGGAGPRPAAEAVVLGAALAVLAQFVAAPAHAGALAQLRRAGLARAEAARAVDTAGPLGDKSPAAAPSSAEPLPA